MADIHVWQVAFGHKVDPGLTPEQALAQLMAEDKAKQDTVDKLAEQMRQALADVDALKRGTAK